MVRRIKPVSRSRKDEARVRAAAPGRRIAEPRLPAPGEVTSPAVDISETATEFIIEMELPGVDSTDVRVLLFASRLEVSGFKRELAAPGGSRYMRLEREYGAFQRDVVVPGTIEPDQAAAALENGVLTIVLRKPPRRRREVEIKVRRDGG
ncbi:MAG TPA: Hsp20/alpha crystallin family protein [Candidatus Aminicenantes bacterium]|nr:Hsp20/alpha crystallin family protein [Candidatus Aminicenantes bacterium]HRY65920.1 Hsp20/alpha crystallin family protein [Candidatus Aminicenantes bacterium]HRZ72754.1 Hsp20/alpha crystallin family protein [Candidatus Aminicenantes bacterium]